MLAHRRPSLWTILLFALLSACAPRETMTPNAAEHPLLSSLQVTRAADVVELALQVTNTGAAAVPVEFASGQSFDFAVIGGEGEVWRWSADRMFSQAMRTEVLEPGETRTYTAVWNPPPELSGEFRVEGTLTALQPRLQQSARLELP